jgi:viroplasmin and RNaseH domain-containing protein
MTQQEIRELARDTIGDRQEPNHFFVTTSPWITVTGAEDASDIIDGYSVEDYETLMFDSYEQAKAYYDNTYPDADCGIGTVLLEDRKTGIIAEKRLEKVVRIDYSYTEYDDSKLFGYEK